MSGVRRGQSGPATTPVRGGLRVVRGRRGLPCHSLIEAVADPIVEIDSSGWITDANEAMVRATGVARRHLIGSDLAAYFTEPERARAGVLEALADGAATADAMTIRHVAGRSTDVMMRWTTCRSVDGRAARVVVAARDVTQMRRIERRVAMVAEANHALVHAYDEAVLLQEICAILTTTGGYRLAWIGAAVAEGKQVQTIAQAGFERGYLERAKITWADTERGRGPTGRAIRSRTAQVSRDILHDPAMAPWRADALARGYQSSVALPFVVDEQVLALHAYADRPDAFDEAELSTLDQLGGNLAVGISALRAHAVRERAEVALRAALAYNRTLIEASLDPLFTIDVHGRVADVNQAAAQATGCSRTEMVGSDVATHFTDPERARAAYQKAYADGAVRDWALELRHTDGHTTPVLYNASVYRDEDHQVAGVLAAARDVTSLRRSQEALHRSEALLNQTQRVARVGGWECDVGTGRVTWTDEVYRMHGLTPGEYDPSNPRQNMTFYPPEDRHRLNEAFERAVTRGEPYDLELRLVTVRGHARWVRTAGQAERVDGVTRRVYGHIMDITERKRAELDLTSAHEQLRRLNAELESRVQQRHHQLLARTAELTVANERLRAVNSEMESFSYTVAHDLRAPLRVMSGFAQLLDSRYRDLLDEGGRRMLGIVVNNAARMDQLIDDLLTLAQLRRGDLETETVDMTALAGSIAEGLLSVDPDRDMTFDIEELEPVEGDSSLLTQVWANLLGNAAKFTGQRRHARIRVSSERDGDRVVYHVADNGVGFDEAYADKLFVVFSRLHPQSDFPGTGAGLAIVARIVARHGGRVWANAELDRGATFSFALPAKRTPR